MLPVITTANVSLRNVIYYTENKLFSKVMKLRNKYLKKNVWYTITKTPISLYVSKKYYVILEHLTVGHFNINATRDNLSSPFCVLWFNYHNSFFHFVVCLTTGPKHLPMHTVHIVQSRASSFRCEYRLLSLRSSSSFLRLLPRLPVTSIPHFIFPSITRRRRQFLRKMWPIQLALSLFISCRIFLCSLTLTLNLPTTTIVAQPFLMFCWPCIIVT
jgi:hypothetical protein